MHVLYLAGLRPLPLAVGTDIAGSFELCVRSKSNTDAVFLVHSGPSDIQLPAPLNYTYPITLKCDPRAFDDDL